MHESEISDWEREIKHAQMMQEQRIDSVRATYEVPQNIYTDPAKDSKDDE